MATAAIKKELHKAIDIMASEQLLKAIYMILNEELKKTEQEIKSFTLEEFYARNAQSQTEIKQEKLLTHKSVKSKMYSIPNKLLLK